MCYRQITRIKAKMQIAAYMYIDCGQEKANYSCISFNNKLITRGTIKDYSMKKVASKSLETMLQ